MVSHFSLFYFKGTISLEEHKTASTHLLNEPPLVKLVNFSHLRHCIWCDYSAFKNANFFFDFRNYFRRADGVLDWAHIIKVRISYIHFYATEMYIMHFLEPARFLNAPLWVLGHCTTTLFSFAKNYKLTFFLYGTCPL